MPIKEVNGYMRVALRTQKNKGMLECPDNAINGYNGVDVDNLYYSKRADQKKRNLDSAQARAKLSKYLTKYISKNNIQSYRLPWHCSRDISALFTKELLNLDEYNRIVLHTQDYPQHYKIYPSDECTVYIPLFPVNLADYTDLQTINNKIYSIFFPKE